MALRHMISGGSLAPNVQLQYQVQLCPGHSHGEPTHTYQLLTWHPLQKAESNRGSQRLSLDVAG